MLMMRPRLRLDHVDVRKTWQGAQRAVQGWSREYDSTSDSGTSSVGRAFRGTRGIDEDVDRAEIPRPPSSNSASRLVRWVTSEVDAEGDLPPAFLMSGGSGNRRVRCGGPRAQR